VLPLAWNDLSHRIRNLPRASLNKGAPKRMSLAGAQHKMVVIYEPKSQELGEPLKGTPSTHILKPNSTAEGYPNSVINETFTMMLAARLGLNVPKVWHLYLPEPVFIIERFDRAPGPDGAPATACAGRHSDAQRALVQQVQQRDVSQAQRPHRAVPQQGSVARMEVFRWIVFNTMVGNSDSHLKNISFIVDHEGRRVAPFYDLLCTAVYHTRVFLAEGAVWPNEKLASPVAGANFFSEVTYDKLIDTGLELGLNQVTAAREVTKMVGRLAETAEGIAKELEASMRAPGSPNGNPSPQTVGAQCHLLRSIRSIVIADMLRYVRLPVAAAKEPQ
jgi:serine/threonine-protein kinase HipA